MGTDPRVLEEFERHKKVIEGRYANFLPKRFQEKLHVANAKLLTPYSFTQTPAEFEKRTGFQIPEKSPAKFATAFANSKDKAYSAPLIYMSEQAFHHSDYSKSTTNPLATYIHEFNHYILYVLQDKPIENLRNIVGETIGWHPTQAFEEYALHLSRSPKADKQKREEMGLAVYYMVLKQQYEKVTRLIDTKILPAIGLQPELTWRKKPKQYTSFEIPTLGVYALPHEDTDPFINMTDREVVEAYVHWEDRYQDRSNMPQIKKIVEVAKQKPFEKLSLEALHKLYS
jgi:hypothetical protein